MTPNTRRIRKLGLTPNTREKSGKGRQNPRIDEEGNRKSVECGDLTLPALYLHYKNPKLYFCDVGLVCYLLGIVTARQIETHPLRGQLFENLVITEILKHRLNIGNRNDLMFFRDSNGNEVDLLVPGANCFEAIEIKSARTFSPAFLKGLTQFAASVSEEVAQYVVYNGTETLETRGTKVLSFTDLNKIVK